METIVPFFKNTTDSIPRAAILLSGSGSNAEKILESQQKAGPERPFDITLLFTDAPERSRARELAATYQVPLLENDIRRFYRERGQERMSIATPEGQKIRAEWTATVRAQFEEYGIDFCVMAGFVPLTNLTADYPALNVHPGDLTYLKDGKRYLVGLHTVPIERAILEGLDYLRSSVIVAQPYTGHGGEMDSGPLLGVSEAVTLDLQGTTVDELREGAAKRPEKRPRGGYKDRLEEIAKHNQEKLKHEGDWVVLPAVVTDFAKQKFGTDSESNLYYHTGRTWVAVETVVYGDRKRELILQQTE